MPEQASGDQTPTKRKKEKPKWQPPPVERVIFLDHVTPSDMEWGDVAEDLCPVMVAGVGFIRRETDQELELVSYLCEPDEDSSQSGTGKFTILKSTIVSRETLKPKGRRGQAPS